MKFPSFIQSGDTIGFAAPSFGCAIEPYYTAFQNTLKKFEERGFLTTLGPNCYSDCGIGISNTPEKCAEEWMQMYLSSDSDCLISCGGGELMCEILEHIDFCQIAAARPKWFMGYSDNTNLTFLLTTLADTASLYGPCAAAFGMEPWHAAIEDAFHLLQGKKMEVHNYPLWEKESEKDEEHPLTPYCVTEPFQLQTDPPKTDVEFSGRLVGGCLDCLSNLAGTRFDKVAEFASKYKKDGIVWFLEACDLNVMDIRRVLWKLKESGWFQYVKGFLIGRPMHFEEPMMGLDRHTAVTGILKEFEVPIVMDLDIGHLPPMMPLICGSYATVKTDGNSIHIKMEMKTNE